MRPSIPAPRNGPAGPEQESEELDMLSRESQVIGEVWAQYITIGPVGEAIFIPRTKGKHTNALGKRWCG